MSTQATPSRRSKRYQQLVTPVHPRAWVDKSTSWSSEPFYFRPSIPQDYQALAEDENWKPTSNMQTVFYCSFTRSRSLPPLSLNGKPRSRSEASTREVFEVGDTVCVSTGTAGHDSVGVIASMWELRTDESEGAQANMFIRIHWFQRPTELPRVRPRREHTEVSRRATSLLPVPNHAKRTKCTSPLTRKQSCHIRMSFPTAP
jgi:origin recognition complex subunit 1